MNLGKNIDMCQLVGGRLYRESLLLIEKQFFYSTVYKDVHFQVRESLAEITPFINWTTLSYLLAQKSNEYFLHEHR